MARYEMMRIGTEQQPIVIIDAFATNPDAVREAAAQRPFVPARHAYPGIRADLPEDYWPAQVGMVHEAGAMIGLDGNRIDLIDASFSIVTTPRTELSLSQRLPHCDSHEPHRVAFVHYLDPTGDSGGTAFFRHRSTRFETIDRQQAPIYEGQLDAELRYGRHPAADYIGGEDPLFDLIATIPARFNRAILYRSFALHSGAIPATASLSGDPLRGRLTVTGFLAFA